MKLATLALLITLIFSLSGCFVGKVASLPFKAVGAITPGVVGTTISTVGTGVDIITPF